MWSFTFYKKILCHNKSHTTGGVELNSYIYINIKTVNSFSYDSEQLYGFSLEEKEKFIHISFRYRNVKSCTYK